MKKSYLLTLALLTSTIAVASEDEHREHGAHEHGHARLNVVLDNYDLVLMVESPAMNVFGFEHEPKNDEQKKTIQSSTHDLEEFGSLLTLDAAAKCSVIKTDVDHPFHVANADKHGYEEDKHGHEESTHSDVGIEVTYKCEKPAKLSKMDLTPLFKRFPLFMELETQGIINGQQSAKELTKEAPIFSLKK